MSFRNSKGRWLSRSTGARCQAGSAGSLPRAHARLPSPQRQPGPQSSGARGGLPTGSGTAFATHFQGGAGCPDRLLILCALRKPHQVLVGGATLLEAQPVRGGWALTHPPRSQSRRVRLHVARDSRRGFPRPLSPRARAAAPGVVSNPLRPVGPPPRRGAQRPRGSPVRPTPGSRRRRRGAAGGGSEASPALAPARRPDWSPGARRPGVGCGRRRTGAPPPHRGAPGPSGGRAAPVSECGSPAPSAPRPGRSAPEGGGRPRAARAGAGGAGGPAPRGCRRGWSAGRRRAAAAAADAEPRRTGGRSAGCTRAPPLPDRPAAPPSRPSRARSPPPPGPSPPPLRSTPPAARLSGGGAWGQGADLHAAAAAAACAEPAAAGARARARARPARPHASGAALGGAKVKTGS